MDPSIFDPLVNVTVLRIWHVKPAVWHPRTNFTPGYKHKRIDDYGSILNAAQNPEKEKISIFSTLGLYTFWGGALRWVACLTQSRKGIKNSHPCRERKKSVCNMRICAASKSTRGRPFFPRWVWNLETRPSLLYFFFFSIALCGSRKSRHEDWEVPEVGSTAETIINSGPSANLVRERFFLIDVKSRGPHIRLHVHTYIHMYSHQAFVGGENCQWKSGVVVFGGNGSTVDVGISKSTRPSQHGTREFHRWSEVPTRCLSHYPLIDFSLTRKSRWTCVRVPQTTPVLWK